MSLKTTPRQTYGSYSAPPFGDPNGSLEERCAWMRARQAVKRARQATKKAVRTPKRPPNLSW